MSSIFSEENRPFYRSASLMHPPVFYVYTRLLTGTQWSVLVAVAKDEPLKNPMSREFIQNHQLGAASTVHTAIKMLQKNEIVIEDQGRYLVHDVLL